MREAGVHVVQQRAVLLAAEVERPGDRAGTLIKGNIMLTLRCNASCQLRTHPQLHRSEQEGMPIRAPDPGDLPSSQGC